MVKKQERRDPLRVSAEPIDDVPAVLATRPRVAGQRSREWEKQHKVVAYRGIPSDVQDRIKQIAADIGVPVGEIVRYLLEQGLATYDAGRLQFPQAQARGKKTLYSR